MDKHTPITPYKPKKLKYPPVLKKKEPEPQTIKPLSMEFSAEDMKAAGAIILHPPREGAKFGVSNSTNNPSRPYWAIKQTTPPFSFSYFLWADGLDFKKLKPNPDVKISDGKVVWERKKDETFKTVVNSNESASLLKMRVDIDMISKNMSENSETTAKEFKEIHSQLFEIKALLSKIYSAIGVDQWPTQDDENESVEESAEGGELLSDEEEEEEPPKKKFKKSTSDK